MDQKVKQHRFLVFMAFTHTKKVDTESFIKGQDPDPDPTKKVRIRPDPDPQHCFKLHLYRNYFICLYLNK
jgi:hypothetical protein